MKNAPTQSVRRWLHACHASLAKSLSLVLLGLSLQAAAQSEAGSVYMETRQAGENARIEVLSGVYAAAQNVVSGQARLLFYRTPQENLLPGATTIFVNDAYHTSLSAGAWSDLCLLPGKLETAARQMRVGSQPRDQVDTITALNAQSGQTLYVRVHERSGRPVLQPVSAEQAQQDLMGLRRQVHTISRVPQAMACSLAPSTPQAPQQIQLAADALFKFGRGTIDGMTANGEQALQELVQRIRSDYTVIERLHIIGHADPLGRPAANEQLAYARAATVRSFIEQQGLPVQRMTAEGRADREPAVTGCGRTPTPQAIACHQPNRRVVIQVFGQRR